MSDILCLDDVPFQCSSCFSHFPSDASLKLHCFVTGHRRGGRLQQEIFCNCGQNPNEPHQCNSCKLIGVSVEGDRRAEGPHNKLYTQSQLWKCSGCGMLWKCIDCGIFFKGSHKFKQHLPQCNDIEDVLRQLKQEQESDDELEVKDNKFLEEKHNPDTKFPIKQESDIKEEDDSDVKPPIKQEMNNYDIKQEIDSKCDIKEEKSSEGTGTNQGLKRDSDGIVKSEGDSVSCNGIRTRSRRDRNVNED